MKETEEAKRELSYSFRGGSRSCRRCDHGLGALVDGDRNTTLEDPTVSRHSGCWSLRETVLKATFGFSIYP